MARLSKDARTQPRTKYGTSTYVNTLRRFGTWKMTVALLVTMCVTQAFAPFGWLYWTLLVLYVVQMVTGYWVGNWWSRSTDAQIERGPSWRRKDSRTTDGAERGTSWAKDE